MKNFGQRIAMFVTFFILVTGITLALVIHQSMAPAARDLAGGVGLGAMICGLPFALTLAIAGLIIYALLRDRSRAAHRSNINHFHLPPGSGYPTPQQPPALGYDYDPWPTARAPQRERAFEIIGEDQ